MGMFVRLGSLVLCWSLVLFALAGQDSVGQWLALEAQAQLTLERSLQVAAWLLGALLVNTLARVLIWDGLVQRALGHPVPALLVQLSNAVVIFIAVLLVVHHVFGASILGFLTALGAVSVIIAFGLRGLVSDLFTGLAINVERPFQLGDWIAFYDTQGGELKGRVEQINWRTTHVVAENQNYLVIPNREIGDSTLINFWRPKRANRDELSVTLDYLIAVDEARRILQAAASAVLHQPGFVAARPPEVLIAELGQHGVEYLIRYWIRPWDGVSPSRARSRIQMSILRHLRLAGITPAYKKLEHFQQPKPEVLQAGSQAHLSMPRMLRLIDFFSPLNETEIETLIHQGQTRLWEADQSLIREGDPGESMFVILQGLAGVFVAHDGEPIAIAQLEAGEFFGEMSLLTGAPRGATISAITQVMTLEVSKSTFQTLVQQRPQLLEGLSELMAARLAANESAREEAEASQDSSDQRGAAAMLEKIRAFFRQS